MLTTGPTAEEVGRFLRDGAVLLDPPFEPSTVDAARDEVERLLPTQPSVVRYGATCSFFAPALSELLSHPYLERAAQLAVDSPDVTIFQTAITKVAPEPGAQWGFEQHIDIDYRPIDWQHSPRQIICSFFVWLTDVNERRAPMVYRPGSHRALASNRERTRDRLRQKPQVHGRSFDQLPALDLAGPQPIVARAGQASMLTTALVHGASVNVDAENRCVLVVTFTARSVRIDLPLDQAHERRRYLRKLADLLPPDRRHIATV